MGIELIAGVLVVFGLIAFFAIGTYNGLVARRNRIDEATGQIEVQLKRRFDLIPNLVSAVKGVMEFESGTIERVTAARAGVAAAGSGITPDRVSAENVLGSALAGFRVQVEAYPALRSNENVIALQEQLTTTENQLAFSRQHYNSVVLEFRNAVQTFPNSLVAGIFGFRASAYAFFDAPEEANAVPTVDLSLGR